MNAPSLSAAPPLTGIAASEVSRSFHGAPVVRHASLHVPPGSITALVGPNGSGKTTLMLMLATLLRPDQGTIHIGGHDVADDPVAARSVLGWMPDALGAWDALTVHETLIATARMYGFARTGASNRVSELLRDTDLEGLAHQRTHTLSRGQKQRLSLARALTHSPGTLLLDEPSSGLDPHARRRQRDTLRRLAGEGAAILVTSHVLDELEHLANDVVFMNQGRTSTAEPPQPDGHRGDAQAGSGTVAAPATPTDVWRLRSQDPDALEHRLTELGYTWKRRVAVAGVFTLVEVAGEQAAVTLIQTLVSEGLPLAEFSPVAGAIERGFARQSDPHTSAQDPS